MIGVFDSGSGGLTVVKAIREKLPSADILYFGDIKNAPYGVRSREELSKLTFAGLKLLADKGAARIVSACNSVSASLAVSLLDASNIKSDQLIEMVSPTVGYFRHADTPILLCATKATIESGIYQNAFSMLGKEIQTLAIPELAGAIEFGKSEEEIEEIIKVALATVPADSYRVVILACTHYPLVQHVFERVLGPNVMVFDPAEAVAERVEKLWWPQEVGKGTARFMISKDSEPFRRFVAETMGQSAYTVEVIE
jgi:glutamate racemase